MNYVLNSETCGYSNCNHFISRFPIRFLKSQSRLAIDWPTHCAVSAISHDIDAIDKWRNAWLPL